MVSIPYNPFTKELDDLTASDLAVLRDVSEGWHIEYKRDATNAQSIAKSISAFANHYGGWVFYGVEGDEKTENTASAFPGIETNEVATFLQRISQAATDSVTPPPYYEHKVLYGPWADIGLSADRAIVVVAVPSGPDAPYVHKTGRIYRRVADSSDPKPESDRFTLDQLWQRRRSAHERLAAFFEARPVISQGEDDTSFVHLFLLHDPLGVSRQRSQLSFERFVEFMSYPNDTLDDNVIGMPFDNFFTMSDGFVARKVEKNDPYSLSLTWKYYNNGSSLISIPFSSAKVSAIEYEDWLHGYEQEQNFIEQLVAEGHEGWVLDVNPLTWIIPPIVSQQRQLMKEAYLTGPVYAKAALENIWRRIPFLDTEYYIQFIERHRIPIIQFDEEFAPPGVSFESLQLLPDRSDAATQSTSENVMLIVQFAEAFNVVLNILQALGLPRNVYIEDGDGNWFRAAHRAFEIMKRRSEV